MGAITPISSSEGRSSPDVCMEYDASKPVAAPRPRRIILRPQVFLSESEQVLRQPLAHMHQSIRRLRTNGVMGILCLVGFCFMGMIFVTNRVFFRFEDSRLPGLGSPAAVRRRIIALQPDSLLVDGGLRGVVFYATSWKHGNSNSNRVAAPMYKTKMKEAPKRTFDKHHKSRTSARHNHLPPKQKSGLTNKWPQLLEVKPSLTILAEVEAERRVARGIGIVVPPPPKLWITKNASFDLLDSRMYKPVQEVKPSSVAPRVMFIDDSWTSTVITHPRIEEYPAEFTDNTQLYSILDSGDERVQHMELREPFVQGECVPMQDWQTTFYPSCNGMHELGLENLGEDDVYNVGLFGTKGYWRNAWKFESQSNFSETGSRDTFVVKTLK